MTELNDINKGQCKDCSPTDTVNRIKSILSEHGVTPELHWYESGVPYCYSNWLTVPGTTFQTNGKGLSEKLALASAYGEFIERLQVGFIYGPTTLKDGDFAIDDPKYDLVPATELLAKNRGWYQRMADLLFESISEPISPEQILTQCATKEGLVSVTPYYDLTTKEKVLFPTVLQKRIFGSNGCAAGNTPEEALVQSISEIVERNHQIRIVKEGLALPEIPDDFLKKHPVAYKIIEFVRNNGYKIFIKDASLNTDFPVVCACIIDTRTGYYHTHFGAHPVFQIALERALTESFQGRNIQGIAKNVDFSPKTSKKFSLHAFYTELRFSSGNKLPSFFVDDSQFQFNPEMGATGNNRQLLRFCVEYFEKRNLSVLARDCSCLGFPTFQVIVPGYSECYINRISSKTDDQRYAPYAISVLRNPSKASIPDMLGLLMQLDKINTLTPNRHELNSFSMLAKHPCGTSASDQQYLKFAALGYVYYTLGRYGESAACINRMIPHEKDQSKEYLICLKRYLAMLAEGYHADYAKKVITLFHSPDSVEKLEKSLRSKTNPLDAYILKCDMTCSEHCLLRNECYLKKVDAIAAMLDEKLKQLSFDETCNYLRSIQ